MNISTKVRAFTANLANKPKSNIGVIIGKHEPFRSGHPEDEYLSTNFTVKFNSGEVMTLPSGFLTPLY